MKKIIFILLLCSGCSTYIIKGKKIKVREQTPRNYGFVLAIGYGFGEQFKRPSK